jgi:hypothetical protein
MSTPHFKQIFTSDYELQKIQSNTKETFDALTISEFIGGNFVDATITTSDTIVNHLLNRKYKGWVITDKNAAQHVYRSSTVNANPERQIILKSSGTVTVTLYIF